MKTLGFSPLLAGIALTMTTLPALAGNGAPSGPHYNLNIIGVENAKKADMTGSNRHTIFVPLYSKTTGVNSTDGTVIVDSKIWLTPGADFKVCDGNGFDLAYGCPDDGFDEDWNGTYLNDDNELVEMASKKNGAVFQLPCNTNLPVDEDGVELLTCDGEAEASYQVWARALGKPGGSATATTCATVQDEIQCSLENTVMTRAKGQSSFTEVTNELTSLLVSYCWEYDLDGNCISESLTRVALFAGETEDWFWNYDNKGLRLAQLRFYEVE